jgi:hypothetical protein
VAVAEWPKIALMIFPKMLIALSQVRCEDLNDIACVHVPAPVVKNLAVATYRLLSSVLPVQDRNITHALRVHSAWQPH